MNKPYHVGWFEGEANSHFQCWREFDTEDEARAFVQAHYVEAEPEGQPQNVAILFENRIIFDRRFVQLN